MTHTEKILEVLADGEWHNVIDIMRIAFPGRINVAIRARIANINEHGIKTYSRIGNNGQGEYRLTPLGCERVHVKSANKYQVEQTGQVILL
jgi:hypothetical protein